MKTENAELTAREERLQEILLDYVEAVEQGQAPDRRELFASWPQFASELEEFFAAQDQVERLTAHLRAPFQESAPREPEPFPLAKVEGAPSGPASELGQLGDFRLLHEIGRGGMGIVYEAEQISLNRRVALKVLPFAAALEPKQLQRFKNEAQAAAQLHHTNIVPVYAINTERGVHYYAMQFIDGHGLDYVIEELRRLRSTGPQTAASRHRGPETRKRGDDLGRASTSVKAAVATSTERSCRGREFFHWVARIGMKAAEALDHAHQMGIVHRDIKPANLLVDVHGNLWITDFGLAMFQADAALTMTGEILGTLRYMSREQACAKRGLVDHRTDIYSLGVTLYELLTLRPMFEGLDRNEMLHHIAFEEPPSPRSVDKTIPVELETILLKAIAKNPAERYATAQELADDLKRFVEDKPILARRPTVWVKALKWSRRHKAAVYSVGFLLLTAVLGWVISTVLIAQAYEREHEQRARAEENFRQARKAVDFFAGVSEYELADLPGSQGLRRKLLHEALDYYQDFIDQHPDDPSLQAELAESKARVDKILRELGSTPVASLVSQKSVQEDLKLTEGQVTKLVHLWEQLPDKFRAVRRDFGKLAPDEIRRKWADLGRANEKAVAELLTLEQTRRLNQIALQLKGSRAFTDPDVVKALALTEDQKKKIWEIQVESLGVMGESHQHRNSPDRQASRQALQEKILNSLSPDQRTKWKEMSGEPFKGSIHFGPPRKPRSGE